MSGGVPPLSNNYWGSLGDLPLLDEPFSLDPATSLEDTSEHSVSPPEDQPSSALSNEDLSSTSNTFAGFNCQDEQREPVAEVNIDSPKLETPEELNPFFAKEGKIAENSVIDNKKALGFDYRKIIFAPRGWQEEERAKLLTLVAQFGFNWVEIAKKMQETGYLRNREVCRIQYNRICRLRGVDKAAFLRVPIKIKRHHTHPVKYWSEEEKNLLQKLIQENKDVSKKWAKISKILELHGFHRDRNTCRVKAIDLQSGELDESKPNLLDILSLFNLVPIYSAFGCKIRWQEIQKEHFPNRTDKFLRLLYKRSLRLLKKCDPAKPLIERLQEVSEQMQK